MVTPSPAQLNAAIAEARAQLTAISGWINYNSQISDPQMLSFMTKVLTAALNVQSPKGK
jgi:hypothetical protein